jgi:hypothetical protein
MGTMLCCAALALSLAGSIAGPLSVSCAAGCVVVAAGKVRWLKLRA